MGYGEGKQVVVVVACLMSGEGQEQEQGEEEGEERGEAELEGCGMKEIWI